MRGATLVVRHEANFGAGTYPTLTIIITISSYTIITITITITIM